MAYATADDLSARFDARGVAQLASDNDDPVDDADLSSNPVVAAALEDASADIDAALLAAGRYSAADLAGLTGTSLALLKRMTCELAHVYLTERRANLSDDQTRRHEAIRTRHLEPLRKGTNVFGLPEAIEAGLPHAHGPSTLQLQAIGNSSARLRGKYYPRVR